MNVNENEKRVYNFDNPDRLKAMTIAKEILSLFPLDHKSATREQLAENAISLVAGALLYAKTSASTIGITAKDFLALAQLIDAEVESVWESPS